MSVPTPWQEANYISLSDSNSFTKKLKTLQKLATISFNNDPCMRIFWDDDMRKVRFSVSNNEVRKNAFRAWCKRDPLKRENFKWWTQDDSNICDSLSAFFGYENFAFTEVFGFVDREKCDFTIQEFMLDVYDYEWSDMAYKMQLEFNVELIPDEENRKDYRNFSSVQI